MEELPAFLTVDELAALLRINRDTAYHLCSTREIPGVRKLGRCIRIHRETVLSWFVGQDRVSCSTRKPR
ncbi:MAG: helix-turn-helix domain-containing protein [Deltaproteobacteria bacterium]|nr:helix-turn-helix domain-containing protein [Deltaproteobacteria bacterium]